MPVLMLVLVLVLVLACTRSEIFDGQTSSEGGVVLPQSVAITLVPPPQAHRRETFTPDLGHDSQGVEKAWDASGRKSI